MIGECNHCRATWETGGVSAQCPRCGAPSPTFRQGPETAYNAPAGYATPTSYPQSAPYPAPYNAPPNPYAMQGPQGAPGPMPGGAYPPPYQQQQQPVIVIQNTNTMMNYQQPMMYPMVVQERKNAGLAVVLSWFFPGGGQFYNGEVGKGLLMLFGFWGTIWFGVGLGFWIWSMVDAYSTANKINQGYVVG